MSSNNAPSNRPSRWGDKEEPRIERSSSKDEQGGGIDERRQAPTRGYDTVGPGPSRHNHHHRHDQPPFSRDREVDRYDNRRSYDRDDRRIDYDWRCMECGIFNDPREERCHRCGEWRPRGGSGANDNRGSWDRDRRGSYDNINSNDDDYYGPPRRNKKPRHETPKKKKPEYPPPFEDDSASYVFDARSGMFYEPASDYFYDPKTKLYYSNKKQVYFTLVKKKDGEGDGQYEFQVVGGGDAAAVVNAGPMTTTTSTAVSNTNDSTVNHQQVNSNTVNTAAGGDKKIAIALKTTTLPSSSSATIDKTTAANRLKLIEKLRKASAATVTATNNNTALTEPPVHKKHAKDLDVWSNRIKEMKGELQQDPSSQTSSNENNQTTTTTTTVKTTASGRPICTVCRRKFANIDKLRQHEQLSALHKENLAKKAAASAATDTAKAAPETTYRDRTKERQLLYSSSSTDGKHVDRLLASVVTNPNTTKTTIIRPEETLGDDNVGNQMMQKMGWKSGNSLGRGGEKVDGGTAAAAAADGLKSEWERIESLAQAGGRGRR